MGYLTKTLTGRLCLRRAFAIGCEAFLFGLGAAGATLLLLEWAYIAHWCLTQAVEGTGGLCDDAQARRLQGWTASWGGLIGHAVISFISGGVVWIASSIFGLLIDMALRRKGRSADPSLAHIVTLGAICALLHNTIVDALLIGGLSRNLAIGPVIAVLVVWYSILDLGAYIIHLVSFLFFGMREFHPTLLLDQYVAWVFWSTSIVSLPFGLAFGFVYARWVRPMILRRWLWLAKAQRPPMST